MAKVRKITAEYQIKAKKAIKTQKKVDKGFKKSKKSAKGFFATSKKGFQGIGSGLSSMSGGLGGIIGAVAGIGAVAIALKQVVAIIADGAKTAARFEKELANVMTLLNPQDIAKFGKELKSGALSVIKDFGFTVETTNKALFDTISAGVDAGKSIKFLRTASKLAIGGVTDVSVAVDGLTSVMNAFGKKTFDAMEASQTFFTAQKFGKTTVAELAANIGKVAPIAAAAGANFKQVAAAMSTLTLSGLKTDEATTGLKAIFTAVIKPASDAAKVFKKYRIELTKGGKIRDIGEILREVQKATKGNVSEMASLFPNVRALGGAAAITSGSMKKYTEILDALNNKTDSAANFQNALAIQTETAEFQMDTLKGAMTALKVRAFDPLIKAFSFFVRLAKKFNFFDDLAEVVLFLSRVLAAILIPSLLVMATAMTPFIAAFFTVIKVLATVIKYVSLFGELGARLLFEFLKPGIVVVKEFFGAIFTGISKAVAKFTPLVKIFQGTKGFFSGLIGGAKTSLEGLRKKQSGQPIRTGGSKPDKKIGDGIVKPDGQVIHTDPKDTIFAAKDPAKMFGGKKGMSIGNMIGTLQINVNGVDDITGAIKSKVKAALDDIATDMANDLGMA